MPPRTNRPNEMSTHPVLRTHPKTGRTALFVNTEFTRRFAHMTTEESEGLLGYLTTHAHRPEFCYVHRWRPGDVVMWDNRAAQHYPVLNRPEGETRRIVAGHRGGRPATVRRQVSALNRGYGVCHRRTATLDLPSLEATANLPCPRPLH